jgi:hypothetical protein
MIPAIAASTWAGSPSHEKRKPSASSVWDLQPFGEAVDLQNSLREARHLRLPAEIGVLPPGATCQSNPPPPKRLSIKLTRAVELNCTCLCLVRSTPTSIPGVIEHAQATTELSNQDLTAMTKRWETS